MSTVHPIIQSMPSVSSISSIDECFICMEITNEPVMSLIDYEINRTCRCHALLHSKCYSKWLRDNTSCPICRRPIIITSQATTINTYHPPVVQYEEVEHGIRVDQIIPAQIVHPINNSVITYFVWVFILIFGCIIGLIIILL